MIMYQFLTISLYFVRFYLKNIDRKVRIKIEDIVVNENRKIAITISPYQVERFILMMVMKETSQKLRNVLQKGLHQKS